MKNLLLAIVATAAAAAQSTEPPAVIQVIRETIKEGHTATHEKVEMDYARAFRNAKFPAHYVALAAMSGPGEVWFLSGYESFTAAERADKELQKPALKGVIDMIDARDGEHRAVSRTMYAIYRKDMSYRPELANLGKSRYVNISSYRVRLGHLEDFMAGGKMFLAAYEKINFPLPVVAYQVISGVPQGLFLFVSPMESLKTFDEIPARERTLAEAMGAENFHKLMKGSGEVFVSMESTLFSINPRMSYVSKATEDADPAFWRPKGSAKPTADTKPKEKAGP